tara:strand:+ start:8 stop:529 length:522 start_codon:yes stop_codon:yes gene_type:complete
LKKNGDDKMNFLNIDPAVLTQAIGTAGWTKSVEVNDDGSLEWFAESGYPTNQEIYTEIDELITDWTYLQAKARLAQYVLSVGRSEVVESQATGEQVWNEETDEMDDVMADAVTVTAIDALDATVEITTYDENEVATTSTVSNPLITADVSERATAQAIVDATSQAVIDTHNGE